MKKRTIKLAFFSLMMTAMLFNCKDKDKDPETPDENITKELDNLNLTSPTLDKPVEPTVTEAKVEESAQAAAVNSALDGIASSGTVPASVSSAATAVSAALPASDVATLNSVSSETINAVAQGGEVSPELQAVLDKALANPAVAAYLPKFTFPTVNGVALKGKRTASTAAFINARTSATEAVEKVEKVLISDACIAAAEAKFTEVKARLDASKTTETAKVDAQYAADIAPLAAEQTACTSGLQAKYDAYRTAIQSQGNGASADIESARAVLGDLYPVLKALVNIQVLGALGGINTLQAADTQACTAVGAAKLAAADAAKTSNQGKVDGAYTTALGQANSLKNEALQSCHNQGGGN